MMELDLKTVAILLVQAAIATSVVITNRSNIKWVEQALNEVKSKLSELQETVTKLRIKVGE